VRVGSVSRKQKTYTRFLLSSSLVFALERHVHRSAQKFCCKLRVGTDRTPSLKGKEPVFLVGCPRLMVQVHVGGVPVRSGNEVFDHD
jgi:hypothetical protein